MSFIASSRDDSFQAKSSNSYDSYVTVPQGARTVPNSPSFGHHLPPRSSYPVYDSMNNAYDPSASTSSELLPPISDHLVSPLVGHHSQPTSPLMGPHGGSGQYFTTFDPAPGAVSSAPHSRQTSHETPRQGYHATMAPSQPARVATPDSGAPPAPAPVPFGSSLKVVQWTPQHGDEGTQVTIILDAAAIRSARPSPVTGHPASFGVGSPALGASTHRHAGVNRRFAVLFGHAPAPTKFTRAQAIDGNGVGQSMSAGPNEDHAFVVLTTFVPARRAMSAPGERAMVFVQSVDTDSHAVVEQCVVGEWDPPVPSSAPPSGHMPATPERSRLSALKRPGDDLASGREAPGLRSPHLAGAGAGAGSIHGSPARSQGEWGAHSAHVQQTHAMHASPPLSQHPFAGSTDEQQQQVAPAAYPQQPELVRTSQIHAPKNGYEATLSHKVILKLQGDLNTMAMGWSNEEWTNRRRLIQFWPQQDGNVINVGFRPIAQSEYVQNAIVISCIFRDEWNECFVTSVDAIYLLEALVGSRFTVEEKNRIRRNLEGFKPQTVSKSKPDAEPFFKLIMGFPNPKPRNIEKDVKVFPWKVLGPALKKIMSKYSANYPLGPDGALVALPPAVTEPTDDDDGTGSASPTGTPHLVHAQVGANATASPHVGGHLALSPHMGHHQHPQQRSPLLAPSASPLMSHAASPRLGPPHQQHHHQQQHGGGPVASTSASPHLGVPYPRSPQQGGAYGSRGGGSAYGPSGSDGAVVGYYAAPPPPPHGTGSNGAQQQQRLYSAADDYSVSRTHYGGLSQQRSPHLGHASSPHLGGPGAGNGGGVSGSGNGNGTPHLRSYSDGVAYSQAGEGQGNGMAQGGYDVSDVQPQRSSQWGPPPPQDSVGELDAGGARDEP